MDLKTPALHGRTLDRLMVDAENQLSSLVSSCLESTACIQGQTGFSGISREIQDQPYGGLGVLAPLAGYTDFPFRMLLSHWGVGLYFTEMISAKGLLQDCERTLSLAQSHSSCRPLCAQLFGTVPQEMAQAAELLARLGHVDAIDINMGCPVRKVVTGGAGSALMRTPELAANIVRAVSQAVTLPVTVKIRSGWDSSSINAPELASLCVEAGAAGVCIHPRTRSQMFGGEPDWNVAARVVSAVAGRVPVVANGNITSTAQWQALREFTGCDSFMIGRAALGAPWIFQEIARGLPEGTIGNEIGRRGKGLNLWYQLLQAVDCYGERSGLVHMRKQAYSFSRCFSGAKGFRTAINGMCSLEDAARIIEDTFDYSPLSEAFEDEDQEALA